MRRYMMLRKIFEYKVPLVAVLIGIIIVEIIWYLLGLP